MSNDNLSAPIRIGINGFGRIGRSVTRKIMQDPKFELVVVNEIESDLLNLEYLLKFDSVYGRFTGTTKTESDSLFINQQKIRFFSESSIGDVPWESYNLDVLIEATGVNANIVASKTLVKSNKVKKIVVTNSHPSVEHTIVFGANNASFEKENHSVISSSICDANAIVPVLHYLNESIGIQTAMITTLHPWLSYQNLLDGPISSVSSPGHNWSEYSLGRSSVGNLILKDTTAGEATIRVLPELEGKIDAISFRVPTNNVSASDFSINLSRKTDLEEVQRIFEDAERKYLDILDNEK
jgi:glyceraldehyde 3-phosphate dehydrogenase